MCLVTYRWEVRRQEVHQDVYLLLIGPRQEVCSCSLVGFCFSEHLTNLIHGHSLGGLGMDQASVRLHGQYLIKLALNLAQKLW